MQNLRKHGVYRPNKCFRNSPIGIGIVDARKTARKTTLARDIEVELGKLNFQIKIC